MPKTIAPIVSLEDVSPLKTGRPSVIGITGTPGTGKKSVGRIVARLLGYSFLELNQVAFDSGSVLRGGGEDGFEVDPARLRNQVLHLMGNGGAVLVGHLLPHVLHRNDAGFIAVLRCSPEGLEERFSDRGYSGEKIRENIASEILDICLGEALERFGPDVLAEFDTTGRDAHDVAEEVVDVFRGNTRRPLGQVRWLSGKSAKHLIDQYLG
jgi:adenylate kinase